MYYVLCVMGYVLFIMWSFCCWRFWCKMLLPSGPSGHRAHRARGPIGPIGPEVRSGPSGHPSTWKLIPIGPIWKSGGSGKCFPIGPRVGSDPSGHVLDLAPKCNHQHNWLTFFWHKAQPLARSTPKTRWARSTSEIDGRTKIFHLANKNSPSGHRAHMGQMVSNCPGCYGSSAIVGKNWRDTRTSVHETDRQVWQPHLGSKTRKACWRVCQILAHQCDLVCCNCEALVRSLAF